MLKALYRFLNPKFQNLALDYKVDFKPRYGHGLPPHRGLQEIISKQDGSYDEILKKALNYKADFWTIKDQKDTSSTTAPSWNNGFLPGLDMVAIYTLIRELKPKRYLEIGSGNSTKMVYKAKQEGQLDTKIISIDPAPRAEIDAISDEIIRAPFETVSYDIVATLEAGDILFIDNSHRMLPNSDCTALFLDILPRLKKGVIVHIHDIYLPYDYPQFMCDRFYSEQYGLAIFILSNPHRYETILPNYYISEHAQLRETIAPIWQHPNLKGVERHGGSYWIKIAADEVNV